MKCISCELEIDPKWSHAINSNSCPFCGNSIMEEHLKNLLSNLKSTMEQLSDYQNELNDWMLSNYEFIKTSSEDLAKYVSKDMIKDMYKNIRNYEEDKSFEKRKFTVKVKNESGQEEDIEAEKIQSDEKANLFFKRAEVQLKNENSQSKQNKFKSIAEKTAYLKDLKNKIEAEGSPGIIDESGLSAMISPEDMSDFDGNLNSEYKNLISGADHMPADIDDNDDFDAIPSQVLAMASRNKNDPNADLDKLNSMHSKMLESRRNFNTSSKGSFSRS